MTTETRKQIDALATLRLPELKARYAEVLGEETRCPNRTWLVRKITEALEAKAVEPTEHAELAQADESQPGPVDASPELTEAIEEERGAAEEEPLQDPDDDFEPTESGDGEQVPEPIAAAPEDYATANAGEPKLTKLSVEELKAKYREVVGRETGSSHKGYLVWKIREAQKGRIPEGPRNVRRNEGDSTEFKILPLRMEAEVVAKLDEARERLGLTSRMELFRRSLNAYLGQAGEHEVAALFAAVG